MAGNGEAYLPRPRESSVASCGGTVTEAEQRVARRQHEPAMRVEGQSDQRSARDHLLGLGGAVHREPINAARASQSVDDVQITSRIKREPLRATETIVKDIDLAVRRDSVDTVASAERGGSDVEKAVGSKRQVEGGHTGRNACEDGRMAIADAQDRTRAIADKQRPVG